jgi:hypothetical protein
VPHDDTLPTIIAIAVIVLTAVWAHNRGDQSGGTDSASEAREPEIGRSPSGNREGAPHEYEAKNGRTDSNRTERALKNWTAVLSVASVFGAIFALFTLNAIRGQLDEMRIASTDMKTSIEATNRLGNETHRLADEAKRSADDATLRTEIELRAYVGITGEIQLNCPACETDTFRPLTPTPNHVMDNSIVIHIQNGGQTPAYSVHAENSFYPTTYEGTLPENFTFPIYPGAQHLAGIGPETAGGVAILNAHDTQLESMSTPLQQDVIALIAQAKHHQISLFWYGNILYTDVFQKSRCTPFCLAYLPDFPRDQQFEPCEKHNTPPKEC